MEDRIYLSECSDDDVLELGEISFKVGKFLKAINEFLDSEKGEELTVHLNNKGVEIAEEILKPNGKYEDYTRWFNEGIDCEILNLGAKSWKKGKMKIKLSAEFYLEEPQDSNNLENPAIIPPESPLDDLRQMISQETQTQS